MSVSGILSSCLLCDDSGADCGWIDCTRCLPLWITGSLDCLAWIIEIAKSFECKMCCLTCDYI